MIDIRERLRNMGLNTCNEAADKIQSLEAELESQSKAYGLAMTENAELRRDADTWKKAAKKVSEYNARLEHKVAKLQRAINGIAPWLSASLSELPEGHDGKYEEACNAIFELDEGGSNVQ